MDECFTVKSIHNTISGLLVLPKGDDGQFPCVVLSHGLVSSKDSSKYVALSEVFAQAGIATCRFDYHGCGESEGNIEETTLTIRLENLDAIVEHVMCHPRLNARKIGLLGSSFGGTTSLVKAARDKRIKCLSFWATPYRLDREDDGKISEIQFRETIFSDFAAYDILSEARNVSCALAIHGEMDEIVPCEQGRTIYRNVKRPKMMEIIKNADHVLSNPVHRERAMNFALNWFRRFFLRS
jgi:uncharacterized protein